MCAVMFIIMFVSSHYTHEACCVCVAQVSHQGVLVPVGTAQGACGPQMYHRIPQRGLWPAVAISEHSPNFGLLILGVETHNSKF